MNRRTLFATVAGGLAAFLCPKPAKATSKREGYPVIIQGPGRAGYEKAREQVQTAWNGNFQKVKIEYSASVAHSWRGWVLYVDDAT